MHRRYVLISLSFSEWGGLDTLHILAGVPTTTALLDLAGVPLIPTSTKRRDFAVDGDTYTDMMTSGKGEPVVPTQKGMDRVAREARACAETNFVGTVFALACFVSDHLKPKEGV